MLQPALRPNGGRLFLLSRLPCGFYSSYSLAAQDLSSTTITPDKYSRKLHLNVKIKYFSFKSYSFLNFACFLSSDLLTWFLSALPRRTRLFWKGPVYVFNGISFPPENFMNSSLTKPVIFHSLCIFLYTSPSAHTRYL